MKLSIVIPCYDEPTVGGIVERVFQVPLPSDWEREILVVDDGSADVTKGALREAKRAYPALIVITREKNGGKGAAIKTGFKKATGDYLVIQDADLEYDPADIPALLAMVIEKRTEVAFGSRQIQDNNVSGRALYYWGAQAINFLFNLSFGQHISDVATCYKLFPKRFVPELLTQPSDDFVFDVIELTHVLIAAKIVELPIHYRARGKEEGKKLNWRHGMRCAFAIVTLRLGIHGHPLVPQLVRFFVVGISAAAINLFTLYALTAWLGVWYLASSAVAFVAALIYNFTFQKLWAFDNRERRALAHQVPLFIGINLCNLLLNTFLLYLFVSIFGVWYLVGQALASVIIAFESFFAYRWIFSACEE